MEKYFILSFLKHPVKLKPISRYIYRYTVMICDLLQMTKPVAIEDVKKEVRILYSLRGHENIVHFFNAYEDDSFVYIVMEYVLYIL
jgi:serine/threonine protein kinase